MTDHTDAPWFVHDLTGLTGQPQPEDIIVSCSHPDHIPVCTMNRALTGTLEEARANARLIAASPDLMAACRLALTVCSSAGYGGVADRLRDAIAKATASP